MLRQLQKDARAQRLALVTGCLFFLFLLETAAGLWWGSIGLLADALHLAFHSVALCIALYGVLVSKRRATFAFSYGYARYEVLAAFSNTVLLIFMQLFIISGVVHRLLEPAAFERDPREGMGKVVLGAVGVTLNVCAMVLLGVGPTEQLKRFTSAPGSLRAPPSNAAAAAASSSAAGGAVPAPPASSALEGGAALQVYSDAMSSALLVASALLAPYLGSTFADILQATLSAAFTLHLAFPLAHATALTLLQSVPPSHAPLVERAAREASAIDGVLEVTAQNFWLQAPGHGVATATLRLRHDANESQVLAAAQAAYGRVAADVTIQIVKDAGLNLGEWRAMAASGQHTVAEVRPARKNSGEP